MPIAVYKLVSTKTGAEEKVKRRRFSRRRAFKENAEFQKMRYPFAWVLVDGKPYRLEVK